MLLVPTAKFTSKLIYQGSHLRGRLVTILLAKKYKWMIAESFLLEEGVFLSSLHTKRSALYRCDSTKGHCCLFEAVWVTHRLEPIRVRPSWRSCQGDRGHSQMGSLTHRTAGRKQVVCFELGKEVSASQLNDGKYWLWMVGWSSCLLWQATNHQLILFNKTRERQNPGGGLTADCVA